MLSLSLSLSFLLFSPSSPFSLRASTQGAASAHQSRVELVPWRGETQSAFWCINVCLQKTKNKQKKNGCSERGEGNGAKSPHSASDRRRQHPDSFEVEGGGWKRGREIVMEEEGDEEVENIGSWGEEQSAGSLKVIIRYIFIFQNVLLFSTSVI